MREDMCKVIVERPRRGGGRDRKGRITGSFEDMPSKISLRRRHTDLKYLNENLAPLRRFLRKSVGRPWNHVFSEICVNIRLDNAVQRHIRGHVFDYVHPHVTREGKKIFALSRFWGARELWNGDLYVCPKSGILREYRQGTRKAGRRVGPLEEGLKSISSEKSRTVLRQNEVLKVYRNPDTGNFDLANTARPVHAEIDFKEAVLRRGFKPLDLFFTRFSKEIPMGHPYWARYQRLVEDHKSGMAEPLPPD